MCIRHSFRGYGERYGKINDGKQQQTSRQHHWADTKKTRDKGKNKRIKKRNREKLTVRLWNFIGSCAARKLSLKKRMRLSMHGCILHIAHTHSRHGCRKSKRRCTLLTLNLIHYLDFVLRSSRFDSNVREKSEKCWRKIIRRFQVGHACISKEIFREFVMY